MSRATFAPPAPLRTAAGAHNRAVVLLYHRVADLHTDPLLLAVSRARFREQLAMLRSRFTPLSLSEVLEKPVARPQSTAGIVITFDDGYADNFHHAKPMLEHERMPATVFVASDYLRGGREFWWDELERLILHPDPLPARLALRIRGEVHPWRLDESTLDESDFQRFRAWSVLDPNSPTSRHRVYRELFAALRPLADDERASVLRELRDWSGRPDEVRATHRPLSPEELARMGEGDCIEIGGHTMTHPVLAQLPPDAQEAEIAGCRQSLEGIVQRPVNAFSYPFGTRRDYAPHTVDIVRQAGFTCACSNFTGTVGGDTDHFQIPRILVRDWDAATLLRRLHDVARESLTRP